MYDHGVNTIAKKCVYQTYMKTENLQEIYLCHDIGKCISAHMIKKICLKTSFVYRYRKLVGSKIKINFCTISNFKYFRREVYRD